MRDLKNLDINATNQDIDKFVVIDNESRQMIEEEMLGEANRFLKNSNHI